MGLYPKDKKKAEEKVSKGFTVAVIFNSSNNCPAIKSLKEDYKIWDIAAEYFGVEPMFTGANM